MCCARLLCSYGLHTCRSASCKTFVRPSSKAQTDGLQAAASARDVWAAPPNSTVYPDSVLEGIRYQDRQLY